MKSIYPIIVVGTIFSLGLTSVHADMEMTGTMNMTGAHHMIATGNTLPPTGTGTAFRNYGQGMKAAQEALKQKREEMRRNAEMRRTNRSGSGRTLSGNILTTEQLACARAAVAKRETGILSAHTTLSTSITNAYTTRAAALDTAWSLSGATERRIARDTAWKNWRDAMKSARETNKASRKSTWETFKSEAQTCKVPEVLTEANNAQLED